MTKELGPNDVVRWVNGPRYFGYSLTQQKAKIASGEIPPPMDLSDTGRAKGWLGRVIINHQQKLLAAAAESLARHASADLSEVVGKTRTEQHIGEPRSGRRPTRRARK